jgi:hypothetical protein
MFACTGRQPPGSPKSSPPSAVPRFSPRSSLAPLPLTSGGLSTAPPALALNDSGGKISVLFWLESLVSALRCESGIHDTRIQGQHLRRLIEGPILDQLHRKIEELPGLRAVTAAGTATFADYATALIVCVDPTIPWPFTGWPPTRRCEPTRSSLTLWPAQSSPSDPHLLTAANRPGGRASAAGPSSAS